VGAPPSPPGPVPFSVPFLVVSQFRARHRARILLAGAAAPVSRRRRCCRSFIIAGSICSPSHPRPISQRLPTVRARPHRARILLAGVRPASSRILVELRRSRSYLLPSPSASDFPCPSPTRPSWAPSSRRAAVRTCVPLLDP
jgi:hypothetical protein